MILCYATIIVVSIPCFLLFGKNMVIANLVNKVTLFGSLLLFHNKLKLLDTIYYKHWNRNDKIKKRVKTITFRSVNLIIMNIIFIVINVCMTIAVLFNK